MEIISTTTLQQRVITTGNFLEYYNIDISPRKFELKVKLPQTISFYLQFFGIVR
jgi:hypothetical protein